MSIVPTYLPAFPTSLTPPLGSYFLLHLPFLFCCPQLPWSALMLLKQTLSFTSPCPLPQEQKRLALCCELCPLLDGNKWQAIRSMKRSW